MRRNPCDIVMQPVLGNIGNLLAEPKAQELFWVLECVAWPQLATQGFQRLRESTFISLADIGREIATETTLVQLLTSV